MNYKDKYFSLTLWILSLLSTTFFIGSFTKPEMNTWYSSLNQSSLKPPNYVFGFVWTILYILIAISGWFIFQKSSFPKLKFIKILYFTQLFLNFSWTPLFFYYHLTGFSLLVLLLMDIVVATLIYLTYSTIRWVSILMLPYLLWILLASYLNFFIWKYN